MAEGIVLKQKKKFRVMSNRLARKTKHTLKPKKVRQTTRTRVAALLDSRIYMGLMVIPTLFLLFCHDAINASGASWTRTLSATIGAFDVIFFALFAVEFALNIFAYRKHYLFSWFALLDLIALLSLLPDIAEYVFLADVNSFLGKFSVARVARTARVATRLARLLALLSCSKKKKEDAVGVEPSAIAQRLESRISAKIAVALLLLLLVASLCNIDPDLSSYAKISLSQLEAVAISENFSGPIFAQAYNIYVTQQNVLRLIIGNVVLIDEYDTIKLTQTIYMSEINTALSQSILLQKSDQQLEAGLEIVQTFCIIIILFFACLFISHDLLVLVINPVERMLALIKKLSSTISQFSDTTTQNASDYSSDEDSDDDDGNASSDVESQTASGISEDRETNLLVEFVDSLAQGQIELNEQKRQEHHRKKALSIVGSGVLGWLARKNYTKTVKMYQAREKAAREVLTTERSYFGALQVLSEVFVIPLRESGIVEEEVVNTIFLGLDSIIDYSKVLLIKIEKKFEAWSIHSELGDIFQSLDDMGDAYFGFINNYTHALEMVAKCSESNLKFANFIAEQEKVPACNMLALSSFLIMPVQRAPRYVMLMEQLAKYTPQDHMDYPAVINACSVLKKATLTINERKRDAENRSMVQSIYIRLEPTVDALMTGSCVFHKEGQLEHEGEAYLFFLFNCVLLKCQPKNGGSRLVVVENYTINEICNATQLTDSPHFGLKNAIQIEHDSGRILLCAATPNSQREWMDPLSQLTQKSKRDAAKRNSKLQMSGGIEMKSPVGKFKSFVASDKAKRTSSSGSFKLSP